MSLIVEVLNSISWYEANTQDGRSAYDANAMAVSRLLTEGVAADQCNLLYHDTLEIIEDATTTLDLADGTLENRFGESLVFARLKVILIRPLWTDEAIRAEFRLDGSPLAAGAVSPNFDFPLLVGGGFSAVAPGAAGYVVGASADEIAITAREGTATLDIVLIGANA